jgi:hypothetical protein
LVHLHTLVNLKQVDLEACTLVTSSGIQRLREALPKAVVTGPRPEQR